MAILWSILGLSSFLILSPMLVETNVVHGEASAETGAPQKHSSS